MEGDSDLKREIVGVYDRAAGLYDRVGIRQAAYYGRQLVERLGLAAGARVLDVATGRGALLFEAAQKVGPSGRVIGIDLSPRMVSETLAEIRLRGVSQAGVCRMDADELAFPDGAFDGILCGSALHFFDYTRALSRFRRLLKPGGVIATTHPYVPRSDENLKRWQWLFQLTRAMFPPDFTPPASWTAPNQLNRPELIRAALEAAGFGEIVVTAEECEMYFADEDDWWAWEWSQGSRFWLEGMQPDVLARFKAAAFEQLGQMKGPRGIPIQSGAVLAIARAPGQVL